MHPISPPEGLNVSASHGACLAAAGAVCAGHFEFAPVRPQAIVVVDLDLRQAEEIVDDALFFLQAGHPAKQFTRLALPEAEEGESDRGDGFRHGALDITQTLVGLTELEGTEMSPVIATTLRALLQTFPRPEAFRRHSLSLIKGASHPMEAVCQKLEEMGYDRETVCEYPGQYSVRGGLIDVYPWGAPEPYRLDYFGDEIETIRPFDPTSQLSHGEVGRCLLTTMVEPTGSENDRGHLWDYLPGGVLWYFMEPERLARESPEAFESPDIKGLRDGSLALAWQRPGGGEDLWVGASEIPPETTFFKQGRPVPVRTYPAANLRPALPTGEGEGSRQDFTDASRRGFLAELERCSREGFEIIYVAPKKEEWKRFIEKVSRETDGGTLSPGFREGRLGAGFVWEAGKNAWSPEILTASSAGVIFVTEREVFGRLQSRPIGRMGRSLPRQAEVGRMLDFSDLAEGDFLVHLSHGICVFRGISRMEIDGRPEEVIRLEFADSVTLHLPLSEVHLLSRYVGLTKKRPRLGKPGSGQWKKARDAAERSTLDFAAQLLGLQARRESLPGFAFPPDGDWQGDFEASFPFQETRDQLTAIRDLKSDLERPRPADRLLCGDVGFGKTEVALRGAFKAVMGGKQVAVLAPTTVLAQQHFQTFRERMADFPVVVEMLSRFRSLSEQTGIRRRVREGQVDILVGTHSLLSRRLRFKDLGLLVIDEEHRFGVRQKETLKLFRENVDVLSMSATPIPRTLYLALSGARDLSVIETPPQDRLPVETIVRGYCEDLVRRAIEFEVRRGGQVFYLHNRVQTIGKVARRLGELVPGVRIAVGHGQMEGSELERTMSEFVEGRHQVLVCTTIIESGLDIPNCNTLIIEGADRMGLAQLYQIRGRVGRFNRQAYAYLLFPQRQSIAEASRKRLSALRQYTQLGAGYRIALRDLELRGAGNLIGAQQSGQIAGVGFDLYCQLLRQSIARLRGDRTAASIRAEVKLAFVRTGTGATGPSRAPDRGGFSALRDAETDSLPGSGLVAEIPADWIGETRLRMEIYRQLATAASPEAVQAVAAGIEDRFGKVPEAFKALILVSEIRATAEQRGILSVESDGHRLILRRRTKGGDTWVKTGSRFPRLTQKKPLHKLSEIRDFILQRCP